MNAPSDWYAEFFTGPAVDVARLLFNEAQTRSEADYIAKSLGLAKSSKCLDVPCGDGRLTIELASRGMRMTGLDLSAQLLDAARATAGEKGVDVAWHQGDMRELPWRGEFDGAFCFGNSFAYMDDTGNAAFLAAVHGALKAGGRFLLHTGVLAESMLPGLERRVWYPFGDTLFLIEREYDPARGRLEVEYTFIKNGKIDKRPAAYRIYSYRELCDLLTSVGFADTKGFASMNGEPFTLGAKAAYILARRE